MKEQKKIRIAATGDLHARENSAGAYNELFEEISAKADILALCGDLTDRGLVSEAEVLVRDLASCRIPVVGVLGNHDFEHGNPEEVRKILSQKIHFLDGEPFIIGNTGFVGVKGFCGGFGKYSLSSWGEPMIKQFVQETINDALYLESTLANLDTEHKVAILHYSPIVDTVADEPKEIYPFLGSSRLEEPIDRHGVNLVFHGHAHKGPYEGKTFKGTPVYNVSFTLMKKNNPKQPYAIIEL